MAITMANASSLIPLLIWLLYPSQTANNIPVDLKEALDAMLASGKGCSVVSAKINSPLPHSLSGFLGHLASVLTPKLLHLHAVGYAVGVDLNAWENVQLAGGSLIHTSKCGVRPESGTHTGTSAYYCS
jgi:hypothetical protein